MRWNSRKHQPTADFNVLVIYLTEHGRRRQRWVKTRAADEEGAKAIARRAMDFARNTKVARVLDMEVRKASIWK